MPFARSALNLCQPGKKDRTMCLIVSVLQMPKFVRKRYTMHPRLDAGRFAKTFNLHRLSCPLLSEIIASMIPPEPEMLENNMDYQKNNTCNFQSVLIGRMSCFGQEVQDTFLKGSGPLSCLQYIHSVIQCLRYVWQTGNLS